MLGLSGGHWEGDVVICYMLHVHVHVVDRRRPEREAMEEDDLRHLGKVW